MARDLVETPRRCIFIPLCHKFRHAEGAKYHDSIQVRFGQRREGDAVSERASMVFNVAGP